LLIFFILLTRMDLSTPFSITTWSKLDHRKPWRDPSWKICTLKKQSILPFFTASCVKYDYTSEKLWRISFSTEAVALPKMVMV